jgi:hypothetical protein
MRRTLPLLAVSLFACGRSQPWRGDQPDKPPAEVLKEITAGKCGSSADCPHGFHCAEGTCVLNGDDGPLQITLRWLHNPRTPDDLDLHVVEPNGCEMWWSDKKGDKCGGTAGSLDLDADAACLGIDWFAGANGDTENVIYPPGKTPPLGHYVVRVDHFMSCAFWDTDFEVFVRVNQDVKRFTGHFSFTDSDSGGAGSGRTVTEFDLK